MKVCNAAAFGGFGGKVQGCGYIVGFGATSWVSGVGLLLFAFSYVAVFPLQSAREEPVPMVISDGNPYYRTLVEPFEDLSSSAPLVFVLRSPLLDPFWDPFKGTL